MATYLTRFTSHNEYQSYINNATLPNVSCCDDGDNDIHFMENDQSNLIDHFICIDSMPMSSIEYSDEYGEHEEWSEDYYDYEVSKEDYILNYYLPLARNVNSEIAQDIYKYVGEYEIDNQIYYMWKIIIPYNLILNNNTDMYKKVEYILTYKKSFKGLTVKDNINNRFNPIFAILNHDKNIYKVAPEQLLDRIIFDEWEINYSEEYLTIEALEDGEINFYISESADTDEFQSISYSTNNGDTWITTQNQDNKNDNIEISINVNNGDKILWKGNVTNYGPLSSAGSNGWFNFDCNCNIYGNIMSLIYGDNFKNQTVLKGSFSFLFNECAVVDASKLILPALSLVNYCYFEMFMNCTSLIAAPELPATTLAERCYGYMFQRCTSLEIPPKLPVTILAEACYEGMFDGCTSLIIAPELPATTLAEGCYGVMFDDCVSLTKAPELPATTLVNECYNYMFYNCQNIDYIKAMFTTTPGTQYTPEWVRGVALEGTFIKNANATWDEDDHTGYDGIPIDWICKEQYEPWDPNDPTIDHYITVDSLPTNPDYDEYTGETLKNYDVSEEDYIVNHFLFLNRTPNFCDKLYKYIGEYEYNSQKYYMWELVNGDWVDDNESNMYLLTYKKSFKGLTVRDNMKNIIDSENQYIYNPVFAFLDYDKNVYRTPHNSVRIERNRIFDEWSEKNNYEDQYLTIEALADGTISFIMNEHSTTAITSISYSINNGETWYTTNNRERVQIIHVNVHTGDKVLWKGNATTMSEDDNPAGFFSNIPVNVYGNIMSMLYEDDFQNKFDFPSSNTLFYTFFGAEKSWRINDIYFSGMSTSLKIVNAEHLILPVTTLNNGCYGYMFSYCTSLITAPKLPAYRLAGACYKYMFKGCTSLIKAPKLIFDEPVTACFDYMFENCYSLALIEMSIPTQYKSTMFNGTYTAGWVNNVYNNHGVFLTSPNMSDNDIPRNSNGIPTGWKIVKI